MNSNRATHELHRRIQVLIVAGIVGLLPGCGVEQVAPAHRDIVLQLATATSTRDPKLLDDATAEFDRLLAAGELTKGEEHAFRQILDSAKAGEWEEARRLAYSLRDGQEPTEEDRERVAKRTLREPKAPPGKAPKAKSHAGASN